MSKRVTLRKCICIVILLALLALSVIFMALHYGVAEVSTRDILAVLAEMAGANEVFSVIDVDEQMRMIVGDVRLRRIFLAFLVGIGLSVSGCIFQALLRNPLADPHILGTSSGGALGAVLATAVGIPLIAHGVWAVPVFSFLGSLAAITIVYLLSKRKGALSLYSLLLVGVILNSFFISIVLFIETVVSADQLASIFFWLLGSLAHPNDRLIGIVAGAIVICTSLLFCQTRAINLLTLGEDKAKSLGVHTERTKVACFVCASSITGLAVAVSGLIGFVGLVVPHMVRLLFGPDHRVVLPASALVGGMFLVIADTIARTVLMPQELPVGVVTSFIGAPFFIFLLKKREHKRIF